MLKKLSDYGTADEFAHLLNGALDSWEDLFYNLSGRDDDFERFLAMSIYLYYYDDLIAYDVEDIFDTPNSFINRLCYDIGVKYSYWYRKYQYIQDLFKELDLLQTSKMSSSSHDKTNSVGGNIQKSASTPTGVSTENEGEDLDISMTPSGSDQTVMLESSVTSDSYIEKYTNFMGKNHSTTMATGDRDSEINRQGSINELLEVLEKLPSSFSDEITKAVSKHFIQDYEGESLYD